MPITALPTPPTRSDPATFAARGDAFLAALPTFTAEANALQSDVNAKLVAVDDAAAAIVADAEQTALDRITTGEDRVQTGADAATATVQAAAALASQTAANTSAGAASGSAASALAVYGTSNAMAAALANAQAQASLAAASALSASSVLQQDLSAISAALHRSPNAVTAMFIYDTSKDSDGGAWTEKCQHTSWYNEPISGAWRGQVASEAAARAISGATTGDYFQLTTDGKFYKLNAVSGVTEVFRGNKRAFPKLAGIVAEAGSVTIYDLTEAGCPMWRSWHQVRDYSGKLHDRWSVASGSGGSGTVTCIATNSIIMFGQNQASPNSGYGGGIYYVDLIKDKTYSRQGNYGSSDGLTLNSVADFYSGTYIRNTLETTDNGVQFIAAIVLPDAPIDPVAGLAVPTIAVFTGFGISLIRDNGTVINSSSTTAYTKGTIDAKQIMGVNSTGALVSAAPRSLAASFALTSYLPSTAPALMAVPTVTAQGKSRAFGNASGATLLKENIGSTTKGAAARIGSTFNSGWQNGNTVRAYLADIGAGSVSNPTIVSDRSYKAASATTHGTLTKTEVAAASQLVAYSGFSAANYLREPYSADLDFGTGEWSAGAWVSIPTANTAAATIASRAAATGAYITLGITATTNYLTTTAYDGTTTRTVTTTAAYNTATWVKVRATYKAGKLGLTVNGVEVASTVGAPLLTLNNSNAVLTIGNSYALDAPFPGSIALLKLGATVPTTEQAAWIYEQEKHMFTAGAQVCLPDANAIVDLAYDDATDKWIAVSATNESEWSGLVRTSTKAVPSGAYSKVSATSGVKLYGRTTTTPGVDIEIPAYGLREDVLKKPSTLPATQVFDFDTASFTATTTNASNVLSSVASVVGTAYVGMGITGTGIPAGTTIIGINGTNYYLSANATANGTTIAMGQNTFTLPAGYTAVDVKSAGALVREGASKTWTRAFDGFRETIIFGTAPASAAWVQITARKDI